MEENCQPTDKKKIQYELNPFIGEVLSTLKETVKTKKEFVQGNKSITNSIVSNDGEVKGETALIRFKKVDTEQFTKIYSAKIKNFFNMPTCANLVFEYILNSLGKDQDQIYLYDNDIVQYTKQSSRSCLRGTQWLLENSILARTVRPYWFFINPALFFNGDRMALIEIYEKEDKKLDQKALPENKTFLLDSPPSP